MILHWGNHGEGASEHSVSGHHFPVEIQVNYLEINYMKFYIKGSKILF